MLPARLWVLCVHRIDVLSEHRFRRTVAAATRQQVRAIGTASLDTTPTPSPFPAPAGRSQTIGVFSLRSF